MYQWRKYLWRQWRRKLGESMAAKIRRKYRMAAKAAANLRRRSPVAAAAARSSGINIMAAKSAWHGGGKEARQLKENGWRRHQKARKNGEKHGGMASQ
jgi:hypothetical protein